jgi:parallel beta-helix repeat protein
MTHTFKLARRIARLKPVQGGPITTRSGIPFFQFRRTPAQVLAAALLVALATGCTEDKLTDITSVSQQESGPEQRRGGRGKLIAVVISPDTAAVRPHQSEQFSAKALKSDSTETSVAVVWSATGGTIDSAGIYTAGATAGTFQLIATQSGGTLADTVPITIASETAAATSCLSSPTTICPGENWQTKVNAVGTGATLTIGAGVHRLQSVTPKTGQRFVGQPGAIMSGARLLTGWIQSGTAWYVKGQTQEFGAHGQCESGWHCQYSEDVYRDDVLLRRVLSLGAVVPGTFYFDYAADRIYVGDNPAGHKLEAAAVQWAFNGTSQGAGSGVTIRGLIIEKYATRAQDGAVGRSNAGSNWVIRDNEIRYNHGGGIRGGSGIVIARNNIHHNGQIGIIGGGFARVDSNEIAYNNTAHYDMGWEAGGTKFLGTQNMVARGNFSHHNRGPGLWWDTGNDGALIEGNRVEDNAADGIFWEVSYSAVIRNNVLNRNGFVRRYSREGAGISIYASGAPSGKTLELYGNTLVGNKEGIMAIQSDRGSGRLGTYVVKNLYVHDNTVTMTSGASTGIVRYNGTQPVWTTLNNRFEHNTYYLRAAEAKPFDWAGLARTDAEWRGYGNDNSGTFYR